MLELPDVLINKFIRRDIAIKKGKKSKRF
jgi:hypothetical protein